MIQTQLLLLEILKELKEFRDSPDLSSAIEKHYSLSNSEQRKLESSKAIIARGDELKAYERSIKEFEAKVSNSSLELEEKKKSFDAYLSELKVRESFCVEKANELSEKEVALLSSSAELSKKSASLREAEKVLMIRESELADKHKSVIEFEQQLKSRAAEIRKHTEGL